MAAASQNSPLKPSETLDETAHQACYVFSSTADVNDRPPKRRKTTKRPVEQDQKPVFPLLLNGQEEHQCRDSRYEALLMQTKALEQETKGGKAVYEKVCRFILQQPVTRKNGAIPTVLVNKGSSTFEYHRLIEDLKSAETLPKENVLVVDADCSQNNNLKNSIKALIKDVIVQHNGLDQYNHFVNSRRKTIPLNYDLELLQDYITEKRIGKVVISVEDADVCYSEGFAELVSILSYWVDRLPLILLFGIATSVELFESRLPRSMIRQIDGTSFNLRPPENVYWQLFKACQSVPSTTVWLGEEACNFLSERSQDQSVDAENFVQAIRYAFMSHYFANALTAVSTGLDSLPSPKSRSLCEAIRNTNSFRSHVEAKLEAKEAAIARKLLNDDPYLLSQAKEAISNGQAAMSNILKAVDTISLILSIISESPPSPFELYSLALSTDLTTTPPYREMLLSLKTLPPTKASTLLSHPVLSSALPAANDPSTSLPPYLTSLLPPSPPKTLFLHEAFLTSQRYPLATALAPRPRYAITRALSSPADYLVCDCCADVPEDAVRARLPPTGLLWRLWCEAGATVNVRDLWDAFRGVMVKEEGNEDGDGDGEGAQEEAEEGKVGERMALALFYRGLAEMRMLGFVKGSGRRRGDWLEKRGWKGL